MMIDYNVHPPPPPAVESEQPIDKHPSPPSSSAPLINMSSKKRLLPDSKTPQDSVSPSPDSTLSTDSSSDKLYKRTRELPNLSDCQCCGTRINHTNPKERLKPLDSFWRLVLLCVKCVKRVESGQTCPYCFKEASGANDVCVRCRDCRRRIHNDCVVTFGKSPPWCYCCSNLMFSVCIDCWIPNSLVNTIRFNRRSRETKIDSKQGSEFRTSANVKGVKSLEGVVKDIIRLKEKKSAVAAKAKDKALKKSVMARNAAELANNAFDFVAKKEENGTRSDCLGTSSSSSATAETVALDDAELAFQLHREMNSSPRIVKNFSSANVNLLGRSKLIRTVSESSECTRVLVSGSCTSLGISNSELKTYKRNSLKRNEQQRHASVVLGVGIVEHCDSADENRMASELGSCVKKDHSVNDLHPNNVPTWCPLNSDESNIFNKNSLKEGSCKADRYLLKYSKRHVGSRETLNSENKIPYDFENHGSALGLHANCSNQLRTFCDAPNQSCGLNLQAFACMSGLSHDQP